MLTPAAAYIRVSDERQDEYSPDSQRKLILSFAAKNGFYVPDHLIFYDDGISAKTAVKRDAFQSMIALAKEKDPPFKAIIVWKFSRFARNQEESIVYKNMLKKNGVQVFSVSEPIPEDVYGGLIERVIEWMDEFYLIRLSEEVRRGMTEKASRGETMCAAPFGYTYNKTTKIYDPDPREGPAVADIFRSFLAGEKVKAIAIRLNAAGFRSKRGNPLDNRAIDYILRNPVYTGKIRWSPEGRHSKDRYLKTGQEVLVTPGRHPPLISDDLFSAVQEKIADQKRKYQKYQRPEQTNNVFMLKGLVRCSCCGSTLIRLAVKCPSLQCHSYAKGACTVSHGISIAKANRYVISALEQIVSDDAVTITPTRLEPSERILPDFDKLLAEINRKRSRLSDAYLAGAFSLEDFKLLKSQLDAELSALLAEKEKAEADVPAVDPAAYKEKIRSVLTLIKDPTASEQLKADALRSIISSITFDRPNSRMDLHFYC